MAQFNLKTGSFKFGVAASALAACAGLASPALADFTYADFSSVAGLTFNQDAFQSGNTVSVTPTGTNQRGSVWYSNARQNIALGFVTNFTFRVADIVGLGADGFAFVVQNEGINALGGFGGAIGYGTNPNFPIHPGITESVAVEFDMWANGAGYPDFPSDNHIGVHTMGSAPNSPQNIADLGTANAPVNMSNGAIHTGQVVYTPGSLTVFLNSISVVTVPIDFSTTIALTSGQAWVGFTAATGQPFNSQRLEILSWDFSGTIPAPGSAALLGLGGLIAARRRRN